jgi:hypothetical protein
MSLIEQMEAIAWSMNKAGCQISNLEGFIAGLRGLPDEERVLYLETIEERAIYSQWSVSETDLFWTSRSPVLANLPYASQKHLTGVRVSMFQPHLYLAAAMANATEWVEHYRTGSSLISLVAKRTGLTQDQAKWAAYRYLFGDRGTPEAFKIEKAFPWLQQLIEQFDMTSQDAEVVTPHGTKLSDSIFPKAGFGRYLSQIIKDVVRTGVIQVHSEHGEVPALILQDAVVTTRPEVFISTWSNNHGLMAVRQ